MHLAHVNAPLIWTSTGTFSVTVVPSSCAHKDVFFCFFSAISVWEGGLYGSLSEQPLLLFKTLATLPQANWITAAYHRQRQDFSEYKTFVLLPSRDSVKAPNLIPQQQMLSRAFFCVCFLWGCHNTQTICKAGHQSVKREDVLQGKYDEILTLCVFACACRFIFDKLTHVDCCPLENRSCCWQMATTLVFTSVILL